MSARELRVVPTLAVLLDAPERAMELGPAEAAAVLAKAEGLAAVARERLKAAGSGQLPGREDATPPELPATMPDRPPLLTPEQVAGHFRRSVEWVYRQAKRNPEWRDFTRRDGRTLRFYPALLVPRAPTARARLRPRTALTPRPSTH